MRPVKVYCPVVKADDFMTFDVKMDQLLTAKRALAGDMLNGSGDIGPSDFSIDEVAPDSAGMSSLKAISIDDALRMDWAYFECLVAAIWQKRGYRNVLLTPAQDAGVDIVAISGDAGALIQCKSRGSDEVSLGWDAIKDVVTGEAAYRLQYPGVSFQKICATNQSFNSNAVFHAKQNQVELVTKAELAQLLDEFPVFMSDVEKLRYPNW